MTVLNLFQLKLFYAGESVEQTYPTLMYFHVSHEFATSTPSKHKWQHSSTKSSIQILKIKEMD